MSTRMIFTVPAVASIITSCASSLEKPQQKTVAYLHYEAKSVKLSSGIPGRVYLFPPLLAEQDGKPIESMKPTIGPDGAIERWQAPNAASSHLESRMLRHLKSIGYEVVGFENVLENDQPHSILIVSVLYSKPFALDSQVDNGPDTGILTRISARTFDVSLDPATARGISDLDGLTLCHSKGDNSQLIEQSLGILLKWLGDNVAGVYKITEDCSQDTQ